MYDAAFLSCDLLVALDTKEVLQVPQVPYRTVPDIRKKKIYCMYVPYS